MALKFSKELNEHFKYRLIITSKLNLNKEDYKLVCEFNVEPELNE